MTRLFSAAVLALVLFGATAEPAIAQPPEPLPMGMPYAYQVGNPYWYRPVALFPAAYPFGASAPVYGRYTWDYSVYYPAGLGWYSPNLPVYPYSYQYPTLTGRVFYAYRW